MRILFKHRRRRAFSLVEVIIALALAALVLGLVLRSVALDTLGVAHAISRYQCFVQASQTLEQRMEEGATEPETKSSSELTGEKTGDRADQRVPFQYELSTDAVTADPRFQLISVRVALPTGGFATVGAYRLKIRRPRAAASASPSPGASPGAPSAGSTPSAPSSPPPPSGGSAPAPAPPAAPPPPTSGAAPPAAGGH